MGDSTNNNFNLLYPFGTSFFPANSYVGQQTAAQVLATTAPVSTSKMGSIFSKMQNSSKRKEYLADGTISLGEMLDYMNNDGKTDTDIEQLVKDATGFSKSDIEDIEKQVSDLKTTEKDNFTWTNIWERIKGHTKNENCEYFSNKEDYVKKGGYSDKVTQVEGSNLVRADLVTNEKISGSSNKDLITQYASNKELEEWINATPEKQNQILDTLIQRNDLLSRFYAAIDKSSTYTTDEARKAKKNAISEFVIKGIADGSIDVDSLTMEQFEEAITAASGISPVKKSDNSSSASTDTETLRGTVKTDLEKLAATNESYSAILTSLKDKIDLAGPEDLKAIQQALEKKEFPQITYDDYSGQSQYSGTLANIESKVTQIKDYLNEATGPRYFGRRLSKDNDFYKELLNEIKTKGLTSDEVKRRLIAYDDNVLNKGNAHFDIV